MRRVIIQIYLLMINLDCSSEVILLLQSIIAIGEVAYSHDFKISPHRLLRLYNMSWVHMELCRDLLCSPENISKTRMFGHYLHALTVHLPTQMEIACLRSLNTENQERIFGLARRIAEACTNHHPDEIIPHVMIRLQAQQEQRSVIPKVMKGDSQVSHVAKDLPPFSPTLVKSSFIRRREDSWQVHLKRISPFLLAGAGHTHQMDSFSMMGMILPLTLTLSHFIIGGTPSKMWKIGEIPVGTRSPMIRLQFQHILSSCMMLMATNLEN